MTTPRTDEPTTRLVPQSNWPTAGVVVERGVGRIYVARLGQIGRGYGGEHQLVPRLATESLRKIEATA